MPPSEVAELKQQVALEAARDPNSPVTAADAEKVLINEAKKAGVPAFQFDPNASKEEKEAQLNAGIPPGTKRDIKTKATAIPSDRDGGPPQYDLPPPSKPNALAIPKQDEEVVVNGDIQEPDPDDEWWVKVGWAPRFGEGHHGIDFTTTLADQQTWVEERLQDRFFGDWYYNAGVIIFACLSSWVVAVLGGGLGWVFLVMATCGTYYRTSIRRTRRNFRDDIQREMAKSRLETDTESLEWINSFLVKFWPIYAPVLCKTIVMSVDQVLSVATPPMVESLKMKVFTLGTKPPRLDHVKTYPKSDDDIVLMDWKFSFTPNDTADMTARQVKVKQNPKVVLEVRIGKGIVSKGLDVIVEDMACSGIMRVKVKLQIPFPHIDRVEICFLERPTIDYVCKPLGGDTFGFDINFIPGLESFIQEQIHANLAPMMYAPHVFPIEIAKMLAGNPVDQAIGVVQVTFHGAQGLKNPDQFAGTPDPYAVIKINDRTELARTKTIRENPNPKWAETHNIIVNSLTDSLNLSVYDYNDIRKDRQLGGVAFPLERLEQHHEYENEQLELMLNGKPRGGIQVDIRYFPVLTPVKLQDGTVEPPPETSTGIVRFTVEQAKELDGTKSLIGLLNPYVVLLLNGREVHVSSKLKRTNNPVWPDAHAEVLITDRRTAKLGVVIKDDRELTADPIIGSYQVKVEDMLEACVKGQEWFNLGGVKTGRAKMSLQWRPVDVPGGLGGLGGYIKPIGVMRLYFQNARGLRNVETVGKSDPYARVLLSGVQKERTVTWQNNLNPDWDEVLYVPVHSLREKLTVEVMDEEPLGRDRSLGHLEIPLNDYIRKDESGQYAVSHTKEMLSKPLKSGTNRADKGTLSYTCSFFPTIPTSDPDEEEEDKEKEREANGTATRGSIENGRKSSDTTAVHASAEPVTPKETDATRSRSNTNATMGSHKTTGSHDMAKALAQGETEIVEPEVPKIKITAENLMDYESGLLIFTLIEGDLAQPNCFVEVVMDDMVFPSYTSSKVKLKHHEFNETGDAMVRELDQSKITLRLIEQVDREGKGNDNNVLSKLTGPTLQTLQRCLYNPTQLILRDDQGRESKITVKLKFIPIKMKLDPSESLSNMGHLRVEILDGANLPAMDRGGTSDPYCRFQINGKDVYKTERKNKTLNPSWNENFEASIRSRISTKLEVLVWDWDLADSDDFLGKGIIDLNTLEPFQRKEVTVPLDGKSGTVRVRLLFTPDYITRSRQGSSTFHGTIGGVGKVAGAPIKTVGKGATMVGGGVAKAGSFLGRGFRRRKSRSDSDFDAEEESIVGTPGEGDVPPLPNTPIPTIEGGTPATPSPHARGKSLNAPSIHSLIGATPSPSHGGGEMGNASVYVLYAMGFPPSATVRVHIRPETGKHIKDFVKTKAIRSPSGEVSYGEHEGGHLACSADTLFRVIVKDYSTLGRDDDLGEATFYLSDQGAGGEQAVPVGSGRVVIRSKFEPAEKASTMSGRKSMSLGARMGWSGSRRESKEVIRDARSMTPGT